MQTNRWKQIDELFHAASSRAAHGRAAFLVKACGDDEELRHEVELRLRGVEGLRVVNVSVIPAQITGHTNALVMAIAEKAADLLKRQGEM